MATELAISKTPPAVLAETTAPKTQPRVLIIGGGYAGFYTAWRLEKLMRRGELAVTLVDPLPYMTYQPFLPEVAAGSIEPRHAVVAHRRHLSKTEIVAGRVAKINHKKKIATIAVEGGKQINLEYDHIVVTAGSITRTFPIPGVAEVAIGLKSIEEAVEIRNRLIGNFERAAALPAGPERQRLLTVVVVGAGFAGVEVFAELRSLATYLLRYYPSISFDEVQFHLIEAMGRIMPEVSEKTARWVVADLEKRAARVHLNTQLVSAEKGVIELSDGNKMNADLVIWTAGVAAHPVAKFSDLPLDDRYRITADATLRVISDGEVLEGAWTAGDVAAVPDLTGGGVGGFCVPNAQHAVRQGKLLAKNLLAVARGESPKEYLHHNLGAVAGLGIGVGAFQFRNIGVTGFPAWIMHRGYHGLAVPTWERKIRVFAGWFWNLALRRDVVTIEAMRNPRLGFTTYAARPNKK
jgi:NADH dehydrogenase